MNTRLFREFLESGKMIVYTEGKSYPKDESYATGRGNLEDINVAVLINEGTAIAIPTTRKPTKAYLTPTTLSLLLM